MGKKGNERGLRSVLGGDEHHHSGVLGGGLCPVHLVHHTAGTQHPGVLQAGRGAVFGVPWQC